MCDFDMSGLLARTPSQSVVTSSSKKISQFDDSGESNPVKLEQTCGIAGNTETYWISRNTITAGMDILSIEGQHQGGTQ